MADVEDPAERRRFIRMVLKDIARLEHLLAGVREITCIDAGLEDRPVAEVDLEKILGAFVERYRLQPDAVSCRLEVADGGATVEADPERLAHVFENLLENAAGFSPPGGEIEIDLVCRDQRAVVTICDHGSGIPEEPAIPQSLKPSPPRT